MMKKRLRAYASIRRQLTVFPALLAMTGLLASTLAYAACPSVPTGSRYSYATVPYAGDSASNVVLDAQTGLQWRRCLQGQAWSGSTCTGVASFHSHELAFAQTALESGWRVPNVKELFSLIEDDCVGPSIDTVAFPAANTNWVWAADRMIGYPLLAWAVNFYDGRVNYGDGPRFLGLPVRLVRASQ